MNILLIGTSATFLWRRSESIARPACYKSGREGWEFGEIEDPEASGAGWNSPR